MKIYGFLLGVALMVGGLMAQAQTQTPLVLTADAGGQSFRVSTGTLIEVRLPPFGEMYVSYDPTLLQFVSHYAPTGVTLDMSVESGVVFPEGVQGSEPVILPAHGEPSQTGGGNPLPEMTAEASAVDSISGVGVVVSEPAVQGSGVTNGDENLGTWQFTAIRAGRTVLEFRTFYPPCENDPCPMMPEYSIQYALVITGTPVIEEPMPVEGDLVRLDMSANGQTISLQTGQIVVLDLGEFTSPYNVIYNPDALVHLPGSVPRFVVLTSGFTTRLGIQRGDAVIFQTTLEIPPLCDSCGVMRELIQMENVESVLMMSFPVRVMLTIHALGPSSCTNPILFDEQRTGNLISIHVYRDAGGICTADLGQITLNYALRETLESGNYTIDVNGVRFDVQI